MKKVPEAETRQVNWMEHRQKKEQKNCEEYGKELKN